MARVRTRQQTRQPNSSATSTRATRTYGAAAFGAQTSREAAELTSAVLAPEETPPQHIGAGDEIVGREIFIRWEDGLWYDAIVVRYYPHVNEHKIVYRADDGIEIVDMRLRPWALAAKRNPTPGDVILDGAILEFVYPQDGRRYQAMIYEHNSTGDRVRIAYLDEHSTDSLKGDGWDIISTSPCILEPASNPYEQSREASEVVLMSLEQTNVRMT